MKMILDFLSYVCVMSFTLWCSYAVAEEDGSSKVFGEYIIHYSTFNSLFIEADIAKRHGLVRAKDQTLINIAVQNKQTGKSVAAEVKATAKNLMQQVKNIQFSVIQESDAVYYIGALRHSDREFFHINFSVHVEGETAPYQFTLTKELYTE